MRIKILCPHCNARNEVETTLLGANISCSACKEIYVAQDHSNRDLMPPGKTAPKFVHGVRELPPELEESNEREIINTPFELSPAAYADSDGDAEDSHDYSDSDVGAQFDFDVSQLKGFSQSYSAPAERQESSPEKYVPATHPQDPSTNYRSPVSASDTPTFSYSTLQPDPPLPTDGALPPPLNPERIKKRQSMSLSMIVGLVGGVLALGLVIFGFAFVINITSPKKTAVENEQTNEFDDQADPADVELADLDNANGLGDRLGDPGEANVEDNEEPPVFAGLGERAVDESDDTADAAIEIDEPVDRPLFKPRRPANFTQRLNQLKAATVYVKTKTSQGSQTGSGFLISVDENVGMIVTNAHVVEPPKGRLWGVDCVFNSGTQNEFSAAAHIIGKDVGSDLAILKVTQADLPEPIEIDEDVELQETLSVLILGFPFGDILAIGKRRNPAITVSKGAITSLGRDEYDNVVRIQVDGGINPGNSGGPMVTEDGKLVGISVAKLREADIGFAIPNRILTETRLGRLAFATVSVRPDSFDVKVSFVDPHDNIESAAILVFNPRDQVIDRPRENGRWLKASDDTQTFDIMLRNNEGSVSLDKDDVGAKSKFQIRWTRRDGTVLYSSPSDLKAINKPFRGRRGRNR